MFPRSGVQIRVYVCTGDAIFALWTSTGTTIWTSPFCVWRLLPFGRALLYCLSIPADAGMGVTVPPCHLLVPPAGGTRLSQLLLGWAFLCPLLYGGPVGTRRGLTAQEENEGECVVYGLVIRMTQLQLMTSPRGNLRQEHSIPSAASERRCMSCARQCDRQVQGPALGAYIVFFSHYPWVYRWTCRSPQNPPLKRMISFIIFQQPLFIQMITKYLQ